jgi:ABC-type transport system involved in multi-copper enzyme maturation permease subunit
MMEPLFAILELERDPLRLADVGSYLRTWVQDAGGFAIAGLVVYLIFAMRKADSVGGSDRTQSRTMPGVLLCFVLALAAYVGAAVFASLEPQGPVVEANAGQAPKKIEPLHSAQGDYKQLCLTAGGALSLAGIGLPFFFDLLRVRWRRIAAIAKLSFKEAVRRKVLWVFLAFLLLFLFPSKWFFEVKKEDEVRQTVAIVDFAMSAVFLVSFSMLAAFGIPTDLRNQTIHTVVTKPVQRFEIVVGRFLGCMGLATIVLLVLRTLSLLLIFAGNVSDEAKFESFQAREPLYGDLEYRNRRGVWEGDSVGREWEYRRYIAGGQGVSHRAVFMYRNVPASLAEAESVPVEFSFDIFRTTKGEEGKGVQASLFFITPGWTEDPLKDGSETRLKDYNDELRRLGLNPNRNPEPGDPDWKKWNELSEKFGFFELKGKEIADYHTFRIHVPGGFFKYALNAANKGNPAAPKFEIRAKCESRTQFLGVAKRDLYLVVGNSPFWWNFYKGSFGLWLMTCLTVGLAVAMSTYLSGVVSWLFSMGLVTLGSFRDFIREVAEGQVVGGGPSEAAIRLATNSNLITPLENTPSAQVAQSFDIGAQWVYRRILNMIPDVDRFDFTAYVAEGFNIPGVELLLAFLVLVGYLLPWAVLAYYLLKSREVANY